MTPRLARTVAVVYFVLFAVAVTWPGMIPFNRIYPLVLGLPFSMFWVTLWVVGGIFVFWFVEVIEARERPPEDPE